MGITLTTYLPIEVVNMIYTVLRGLNIGKIHHNIDIIRGTKKARNPPPIWGGSLL